MAIPSLGHSFGTKFAVLLAVSLAFGSRVHCAFFSTNFIGLVYRYCATT